MTQFTVGVITISDRASQGVYEDLGGPALCEAARGFGWHIQAEAVVPDDLPRIQETVRAFSAQGCQLILTTGGTRSLAAVVDRSLVIALPGKPQAAVECVGFVAGAIPHAVRVAAGLPTSC